MRERCLPCLVRLAISDHDGAVHTTKDERRARRGVDRLDECRALLAERVWRLRQEKAEQLLRGQRIVDRNLGKGLQQDTALAGLVQPDERRQRFVAELRSDAPAGQQREVHGPVANVPFLALDEDELVVVQAAELILDSAERLIEQDLRRLLRVTSRRQRENRGQGRRENARQCAPCEHAAILPDERLERVHRLVQRVLRKRSCGWASDASATSAASCVWKKLAARTASSRTPGCGSVARVFSTASGIGDAVSPVAQHASSRRPRPRVARLSIRVKQFRVDLVVPLMHPQRFHHVVFVARVFRI